MSEEYTKLINEYKKELIEIYKLIILVPNYTAASTKECVFCGNTDYIICSHSFLQFQSRGTLLHCESCKHHAYASFLFQLVSNLMIPPEWIIGVELPNTYKAKYIRISQFLNPGKIVIRGESSDILSQRDFIWETLRPRYKDFIWDSLNEQTQNNIRDIIKNVEWPIMYPEWLINMFKDMKI
jgi:hypothetical protein